MTVDELVELVEALTDGMSVADLRAGLLDVEGLSMSDQQYVLLVRFLAGERPQTSPPPAGRARAYDPVPIPDELEHEDETPPRRLGNVADLDEFRGVTLT